MQLKPDLEKASDREVIEAAVVMGLEAVALRASEHMATMVVGTYRRRVAFRGRALRAVMECIEIGPLVDQLMFDGEVPCVRREFDAVVYAVSVAATKRVCRIVKEVLRAS